VKSPFQFLRRLFRRKRDVPQSHTKLTLLLALSDIAFRHAQELLQHMEDDKIGPDHPAYPGLIAGIVVNYARPFGTNRGLGSLPDEFSKVGYLGSTDLQPVHNYIMDMRDRLFAHFDLKKFRALTKGTPGIRPADEIEIEFQQLGFSVTTNEIGPPPENLRLIAQLLFVQRMHISRALYDHLAAWLGKRPANGRYRLTEAGLIPLQTPPS